MRQKKRFEDLEFSDGFLFAATLEDEELCRLVLERILEIPIKKVRVQKESVISVNPEYRGIRVDVFALDDGTCRVFLNTRGTDEAAIPRQLIDFLHFVEKSNVPEIEGNDPLLDRLRNRITSLKRSKKLEDRYMRFGEMLDDERREGHTEGREEGHHECITLIKAMLADGKMAEISRLQEDPQFLAEMLEHYHIIETQEHI